MKRIGLKILGAGVVALLTIQLIPVGAAPTNPAVTGEPPWNSPGVREVDEIGEVLSKGEMPLWDYALLHPEARLTPPEMDALKMGLAATLGTVGEGSSHRSRRNDGDDERDDRL